MSPNKLPLLHRNSRSSQITSKEIRDAFAEDATRNLDRRLDKEAYLLSVMPSG